MAASLAATPRHGSRAHAGWLSCLHVGPSAGEPHLQALRWLASVCHGGLNVPQLRTGSMCRQKKAGYFGALNSGAAAYNADCAHPANKNNTTNK